VNPKDWPEMPLSIQLTAMQWYPNRGPPGTCMECGDKIAGRLFTSRCPPCKARSDEHIWRHMAISGCRQCGKLFCDCGARDFPKHGCIYDAGHKGPCKPPEGHE